MNTRRRAVFFGTAILVLVVLNGLVVQKEHLLSQGRILLLPLAPVDPRSLMQGDYMRLAYALEREVPRGPGQEGDRPDGHLVLVTDAAGVGTFTRFFGGEALASGELLLRYRRRGQGFQVGPPSFFFQEGQAATFARARYGEFRVTPAGDALLVGLRGPDRETLRQK